MISPHDNLCRIAGEVVTLSVSYVREKENSPTISKRKSAGVREKENSHAISKLKSGGFRDKKNSCTVTE